MDQNENTEKNEEIQEENHVQPENGISKEQPTLDNQIERKISEMQKEHGKKFDDKGFKAAAKKQAEEKGTIEGVSTESFVQKDKMDNGQGKSYGLMKKNGKYIAYGSDGSILEGNTFEEINDKVCADLVQHCQAQGKEPTLALLNCNDNKEKQIFSKNAIMKHNATILAGWPEDKQFWQDLKADYLKDEKHTLADWERVTRKIPDDVMGRTPEESARNKKLKDAEILKQMRKGRSYQEQQKEEQERLNKPQQPLNKPQKENKTQAAANNKDLIKAMSGRGGIGGK